MLMEYSSALSILTQGCSFKKRPPELNAFNDDEKLEAKKGKFEKVIDLDTLSGNQKLEQIRYIRHKHKIKVIGTDLPDPITSFDQLQRAYGMSDQLVNNVADMEYRTPTPVQMQAIPVMMERRELMVCAPTGSGKTAAFFLPLIHSLASPLETSSLRGLVLAPTLELARQTHREGVRLSRGSNLRMHLLERPLMTREQLKARGLEDDPSGNWRETVDVLVTTPNRLVWMINQKPPQINLEKVEWLVVDECDKLFEAGKNGFRTQLACIYKACSGSLVCRALYSATSIPELESWAKANLDNIVLLRVGVKNTAVSTVDQSLKYCGTEQGKLIEMKAMARRGLLVPCLIFVQSRDRAKQLFKALVMEDVMVNVTSSDKTPEERDAIMNAFRAGHLSVLICTDLMARGIDFKGISLVINYDVPPSPLEYIHRIGRTGRAGHSGKAVTFWTDADLNLLHSVLGVMKNSGVQIDNKLYQLILKRKPRVKKGKKKKKKQMNVVRGAISDHPPAQPELADTPGEHPDQSQKKKKPEKIHTSKPKRDKIKLLKDAKKHEKRK